MQTDDPLEIRVECHAGYRGEESPRRLVIGGRPMAVTEVLDRWLAPDHRYFKVLAEDDNTYVVRHDTARDVWELTMFRRGKEAE